jgi:hypothetical protein
MWRGGGEADQSGPHDSQTGRPARATVTGNAGPQDSCGEGGKRREGGYVGCAGSRSGLHRIKGDGPLVNISAQVRSSLFFYFLILFQFTNPN